jgi:ketosteroid isomerase-like protein
MSENADLLKRAVDAYNRRDVDGLLETLAPDVEWIPALPGSVGESAPVYRGEDGVRQMMADLHEVLDVIHFDVKETRDLGDTVVAIGTMRTRGKVSGIETEEAYANVGRIRDGKGIRIRGYLDVDEALSDAEAGGA